MKSQDVVVITGASSGIGRDTAHRFAARHARLVLVSRRGEVLQTVAAECLRAGATDAIAVPADIGDAEQVQAVVDTAVAHFGRIDVWVNDAGVGAWGALTELQPEELRRLFEVNVLGTALGTRAAVRAMTPYRRGAIVNVASVLGEVPQPYAAAYSSSKAAIRALSAAVRSELRLQRLHGIRLTTVLPATIDTPIFRNGANRSGRVVRALPPVYPARVVSAAIVRAAHRGGGEVLAGAGGAALVPMHRAFPRLAQRELAMMTRLGQFTRRTAPGTSGNLFEPSPDAEARVDGGWHGAARTRGRALLVLAAVGLGAVAARGLGGRQPAKARGRSRR